jgi:heme exporter protein A
VKSSPVQLQIDGLSKQYSTRWVLRNIHAELQQGDVLLITGHNGAGKSTLLRLLGGLQRPTSGTVTYIVDKEEFEPSDARSFLAMVGPDVQLYRELTAIEHLRFVNDVRGSGYSDDEQRRLLGDVGLGGSEDALVGSFSSGMQQRLRYALALMTEPAVLLLDEPTTNLDAVGIALVDRVVAEQRERGITIIATNDRRDWQYGTLQLALDEE